MYCWFYCSPKRQFAVGDGGLDLEVTNRRGILMDASQSIAVNSLYSTSSLVFSCFEIHGDGF